MGKYVYSFGTEFARCTGIERLTCYAANPHAARKQVSDFLRDCGCAGCRFYWDEPDNLVSVEVTPTNVVPTYA